MGEQIDQPVGQTGDTGVIADKSLQEIKRSGVGQEITVSSHLGAVAFANVADVITLGQTMARAGIAVPKHLRDQPGACTAVVFYASEWGMSPYAVANKSYSVNDRLAFEAQLVHAVIEMRAPLHEDSLNTEYTGDGDQRKLKVYAKCMIRGVVKTLEWESPEIGKIQPKNSPLWKTKPDLQLFYNTSRDWARRHFPHILMGVYAHDELLDSDEMRAEHARDVTPNAGVADRLTGNGEGFRPGNVQAGVDELTQVAADVEVIPAGDRATEKPAGEPEVTGGAKDQGTASQPTGKRRRKAGAAGNEPQTPANPAPDPQSGETTPPAETPTRDIEEEQADIRSGGGGPLPVAQSPPGMIPDPNADPGTQRPLVDEKALEQAPAQPDPSAKEPSSPEEYEAHLDAWLATVETEDALDERWRAERDLRGRCRVVGDAFDRCMSKRNARKKELRE
jgi:hypothetical protein